MSKKSRKLQNSRAQNSSPQNIDALIHNVLMPMLEKALAENKIPDLTDVSKLEEGIAKISSEFRASKKCALVEKFITLYTQYNEHANYRIWLRSYAVLGVGFIFAICSGADYDLKKLSIFEFSLINIIATMIGSSLVQNCKLEVFFLDRLHVLYEEYTGKNAKSSLSMTAQQEVSFAISSIYKLFLLEDDSEHDIKAKLFGYCLQTRLIYLNEALEFSPKVSEIPLIISQIPTLEQYVGVVWALTNLQRPYYLIIGSISMMMLFHDYEDCLSLMLPVICAYDLLIKRISNKIITLMFGKNFDFFKQLVSECRRYVEFSEEMKLYLNKNSRAEEADKTEKNALCFFYLSLLIVNVFYSANEYKKKNNINNIGFFCMIYWARSFRQCIETYFEGKRFPYGTQKSPELESELVVDSSVRIKSKSFVRKNNKADRESHIVSSDKRQQSAIPVVYNMTSSQVVASGNIVIEPMDQQENKKEHRPRGKLETTNVSLAGYSNVESTTESSVEVLGINKGNREPLSDSKVVEVDGSLTKQLLFDDQHQNSKKQAFVKHCIDEFCHLTGFRFNADESDLNMSICNNVENFMQHDMLWEHYYYVKWRFVALIFDIIESEYAEKEPFSTIIAQSDCCLNGMDVVIEMLAVVQSTGDSVSYHELSIQQILREFSSRIVSLIDDSLMTLEDLRLLRRQLSRMSEIYSRDQQSYLVGNLVEDLAEYYVRCWFNCSDSEEQFIQCGIAVYKDNDIFDDSKFLMLLSEAIVKDIKGSVFKEEVLSFIQSQPLLSCLKTIAPAFFLHEYLAYLSGVCRQLQLNYSACFSHSRLFAQYIKDLPEKSRSNQLSIDSVLLIRKLLQTIKEEVPFHSFDPILNNSYRDLSKYYVSSWIESSIDKLEGILENAIDYAYMDQANTFSSDKFNKAFIRSMVADIENESVRSQVESELSNDGNLFFSGYCSQQALDCISDCFISKWVRKNKNDCREIVAQYFADFSQQLTAVFSEQCFLNFFAKQIAEKLDGCIMSTLLCDHIKKKSLAWVCELVGYAELTCEFFGGQVVNDIAKNFLAAVMSAPHGRVFLQGSSVARLLGLPVLSSTDINDIDILLKVPRAMFSSFASRINVFCEDGFDVDCIERPSFINFKIVSKMNDKVVFDVTITDVVKSLIACDHVRPEIILLETGVKAILHSTVEEAQGEFSSLRCVNGFNPTILNNSNHIIKSCAQLAYRAEVFGRTNKVSPGLFSVESLVECSEVSKYEFYLSTMRACLAHIAEVSPQLFDPVLNPLLNEFLNRLIPNLSQSSSSCGVEDSAVLTFEYKH